mmetsp:Transcript_44969/g.104878  ORF Transcript_44969/g.104878 Transcript_44969/m.104878 type:complete len:105 (-) Transcript_44969:119-433(-)
MRQECLMDTAPPVRHMGTVSHTAFHTVLRTDLTAHHTVHHTVPMACLDMAPILGPMAMDLAWEAVLLPEPWGLARQRLGRCFSTMLSDMARRKKRKTRRKRNSR